MDGAAMLTNSTIDWARIEACLDALLDLPEAERPTALVRLAAGDPNLRRELETLLAHAEGEPSWLDRPAIDTLTGEPPAPGLASGQMVGVYRVIEPIGRGGMGEVYRAERADGQFDQQVALKLIRREAIENLTRFQFERQILARLDHPGITKIHDGGVLSDGRPYMAMELVCGIPITQWCREHAAGLGQRLDLFLKVCEAVAYAHRNLIVHRDLKPGNVLVTPDGAVKVLDFGIAKQISDAGSLETRPAPVTPGYAAPEQLTGGAISTATDVYALGMLLFELLAGTRPWALEDLPLAAAVDIVLNQSAPLVSRFAEPALPAKALAGDLDAIVAKALRKEPEHRYQTVDALIDDIVRHREFKPVAARSGSRIYVLGRFIKRHRVAIIGLGIILLAILGGLSGVTWQYLRADREAARATTIKAFLVSLFNDSDPNFPADKPRTAVTATELLALGANRIDREFAQDPKLRVELLDVVAQIYGSMSVSDRSLAVRVRQIAAERVIYGPHDPTFIHDLIDLVWANIAVENWLEAGKRLDEVDRLLRESGRDPSKLRAQWWAAKGEWLKSQPDSAPARLNAFEQAIKLFARFDPHDDAYFSALVNAGTVYLMGGDYAKAKDLYRQAIDVEPKINGLMEVDIEAVRSNLAVAEEALGEFAEAEQNYDAAAKLAEASAGDTQPSYWFPVVRHALLLHKRGERDKADAMFNVLFTKIPNDWSIDTTDSEVRFVYGTCLVSEGRAAEAIPILEAVLATFRTRPLQPSDVRHVLGVLGDAYDRVGRVDEARKALSDSLAEYLAKEPDGPQVLGVRERWGRFLLDHGDAPEAAKAFDAVIARQDRWSTLSAAPALAWGGKARLALAAGDIPAADSASATALAALDTVVGLYDIRGHAYLLRTRAAVLLAAGDKTGAAKAAQAALTESLRTDAPESPAITQARKVLAAAK
jgi:serine/threonine protein kinase/tetratricopeptide (TPR) repeat protein